MTSLVHIADRLINRPLLVTPDKASVILSVLGGRIGLGEGVDASRFVGESYEVNDRGDAVRSLPYRRTPEGVAVISITGSLVNRGAWIGASSGLQSYEGIKHQLSEAGRDPKVSSVVLDIQSPGGEAIGAFETAASVRALAVVKTVVAVVNGMACSAAYAIASGATEIVTTETGVTGSIGVLMVHADHSRRLANEGIKPTLIFAGSHKVDGNPFEPLSAEVQQDLQAEINALYESFLTTVAKGRGKCLTAAAARKTEARAFIGAAAVEAGLADRVGTFETVLAELSRATPTRSNPAKKATTMENQNGTPEAAANGIPQADHTRLVADAEKRGQEAGATAERTRFAAILGADGIRGDAAKMTAAVEMATKFATASAEDVISFVSANVSAPAPAAAAPAQQTPTLAQRMAGDTPLPNASTTTDPQAGKVDRILSNFRAVTGAKAPA